MAETGPGATCPCVSTAGRLDHDSYWNRLCTAPPLAAMPYNHVVMWVNPVGTVRGSYLNPSQESEVLGSVMLALGVGNSPNIKSVFSRYLE